MKCDELSNRVMDILNENYRNVESKGVTGIRGVHEAQLWNDITNGSG
jgi:hypothetical protein